MIVPQQGDYRRLTVSLAAEGPEVGITAAEFRDDMFRMHVAAAAWVLIRAVEAGEYVTTDNANGTASVYWCQDAPRRDAVQC